MLVRSRADTFCPERCRNTLQRTIWDGDQVLAEISAPGATGRPAAEMEADTGWRGTHRVISERCKSRSRVSRATGTRHRGKSNCNALKNS